MSMEAPDWGNDDNDREHPVEFDPFGEFRAKMFNVLCKYQLDIAHSVDFESNIEMKDRLNIGVSFDNETLECDLVITLVLARKNIGQRASSFGIIGETLTSAAQLNNPMIMGALRFIPPHEREVLAEKIREKRDQILLDMEEEGQWAQRQEVTDRIEKICTEIMEIPYID